jgi:hypothetical protein
VLAARIEEEDLLKSMRRFLAARGSGPLQASVTEPGAKSRVWAICPDYETALAVADALEKVLGSGA